FGEEVRATVVMDFTGGQIDLNRITFSGRCVQPGALHNRKAGVDRVPVKRSRKRARDNGFDPEADYRSDGLLPRTPTTEVASGNKNIELPQFRREAVAKHFEGVFR